MGKELHRNLYRNDDALPNCLDLRYVNRDSLEDIYRLHSVSLDECEVLANVIGNIRIREDIRYVEGISEGIDLFDNVHLGSYVDNFLDVGETVGDRFTHIGNLLNTDVKLNDFFVLISKVGYLYTEIAYDLGLSYRDMIVYSGYVNRLVMLDKIILKSVIDDLLFRGVGSLNYSDRYRVLPNLHFILRKDAVDTEFEVSMLRGDLFPFVEDDVFAEGMGVSGVFVSEFLDRLCAHVDGQLGYGVSEFSFTYGDANYRCTLRGNRLRSFETDYVEVSGVVFDVTELDNVAERDLKRAYHDELTGLPTRDLFNSRLSDALDSCEVGQYVGVMFVDVDDFKLINDNYGHDVGDEVLIEISRRLSNCLRSGDVVARNGGDEFTVLCTQVRERGDLNAIVSRIMDSIAGVPIVVNGLSLDISLSIGISKSPNDGNDVETLIKHADVAMYKAKGSGKNKYKFFEIRMNAEELARLELINDLRNALHRNELSLNYQVQFDSVKDRYVGLEALMRWNRPEFGDVSPGEFIDVAEESNLIIDMGYWALKEGCARLRELHDLGEVDMRLSVNLSSKQFRSLDLVDRVRGILDEEGLPADSLVIEITEKTSMEDVERTKHTLRKLREIGVLISIDDFGTGFSSLTYLNEFPLTNLKIDQSFVDKLDREDSSVMMITTFINLANDIGLDVVAEGVETSNQFEILKRLGCKKFQGYYFAKPMAFDDVKRLMEFD